jgi:hypothetical protein
VPFGTDGRQIRWVLGWLIALGQDFLYQFGLGPPVGGEPQVGESVFEDLFGERFERRLYEGFIVNNVPLVEFHRGDSLPFAFEAEWTQSGLQFGGPAFSAALVTLRFVGLPGLAFVEGRLTPLLHGLDLLSPVARHSIPRVGVL